MASEIVELSRASATSSPARVIVLEILARGDGVAAGRREASGAANSSVVAAARARRWRAAGRCRSIRLFEPSFASKRSCPRRNDLWAGADLRPG